MTGAVEVKLSATPVTAQCAGTVSQPSSERALSDAATVRATSRVADNTYWPLSDGEAAPTDT